MECKLDVACEMRPRNSCTWDSNAQLHTESHRDLENRWKKEKKLGCVALSVVMNESYFHVPLTLIAHSHGYYLPILSHIFNYAYRHESSLTARQKKGKSDKN